MWESSNEPDILRKIHGPNIFNDPWGFTEFHDCYEFDIPEDPIEQLKRVNMKQITSDKGSCSTLLVESTCKKCVRVDLYACMDDDAFIEHIRKTLFQFLSEGYVYLMGSIIPKDMIGIEDHRLKAIMLGFRAPGAERPSHELWVTGVFGGSEDLDIPPLGDVAEFEGLEFDDKSNPFANRTVAQKVEGAVIALVRELSCRELMRVVIDDDGQPIVDKDGNKEVESYIPEQWNSRRKRLVNAAVAVAAELNCIEAAIFFNALRKYV